MLPVKWFLLLHDIFKRNGDGVFIYLIRQSYWMAATEADIKWSDLCSQPHSFEHLTASSRAHCHFTEPSTTFLIAAEELRILEVSHLSGSGADMNHSDTISNVSDKQTLRDRGAP